MRALIRLLGRKALDGLPGGVDEHGVVRLKLRTETGTSDPRRCIYQHRSILKCTSFFYLSSILTDLCLLMQGLFLDKLWLWHGKIHACSHSNRIAALFAGFR